MSSFTARYGGTCPSCENPIRPGDEVQYDEDDALHHVLCYTINRPAPPICTQCWMQKPCGCDDE